MEKMVVKNTIVINAPIKEVWRALTDPGKTRIYMYGCEAVSDWNTGSPLTWKMIHEGKEIIPVKGIILEINPPKKLVYTVIDPNAAFPDIPENYLRVTYELEDRSGQTLLTVTQEGFETAAEGERRFKEVSNNGLGWSPILAEIKKLVEHV